MSDLTHLFTIGQPVRCRLDEKYYKGTVKETYPDHIIVDIPEISKHCHKGTALHIDECAATGMEKAGNRAVRKISGKPADSGRCWRW